MDVPTQICSIFESTDGATTSKNEQVHGVVTVPSSTTKRSIQKIQVKVTLVATAVTRTANKIKDIFIKKSKNFPYSSILTQEREGK
jgi:hypothetical protein